MSQLTCVINNIIYVSIAIPVISKDHSDKIFNIAETYNAVYQSASDVKISWFGQNKLTLHFLVPENKFIDFSYVVTHI